MIRWMMLCVALAACASTQSTDPQFTDKTTGFWCEPEGTEGVCYRNDFLCKEKTKGTECVEEDSAYCPGASNFCYRDEDACHAWVQTNPNFGTSCALTE